jgi:hypothetical protein
VDRKGQKVEGVGENVKVRAVSAKKQQGGVIAAEQGLEKELEGMKERDSIPIVNFKLESKSVII